LSHDFPKGLILTPVSEGKQENVAGNQMFASEVALPAHMINSRLLPAVPNTGPGD